MAHLERAVPFSLEGDREDRVLLVHGFTGSPQEHLELGTRLNQAGYSVRCDLLPGHGTSVKDLARTRWPDWYGAVRRAYDEMSADGRPVHVCGMSMGGTLTLHLATHVRPASITVFSAPIYLTDWRLKFLPLLKALVPAVPKPAAGEDIKDPEARREFVGYDADPPVAVASLIELLGHTRADLSEIRCPTLLMHARQDHRVPYGCMEAIREGIGEGAPVETLTFEDSYHVITVDQEKERVFAETLRHIEAHSAETRTAEAA